MAKFCLHHADSKFVSSFQFHNPLFDDADIFVYHYPCIDGQLSAALAYIVKPTMTFIGTTLKDVDVLAEQLSGKRVIFCDVCPTRPHPYLHWVIDHHTRAKEQQSNTNVIYDEVKSGAGLLWWLLTDDDPQSECTPRLIKAVDSTDFTSSSDMGELCVALQDVDCFDCYIQALCDPDNFMKLNSRT